jgi:WD40 repeat protein
MTVLCVLHSENLIKTYDREGNLIATLNEGYNEKACSVWYLRDNNVVGITDDEDDADADHEEGRLYPLQLWDVTTATVVRTLSGHKHGIKSVIELPNNLIATCGKDDFVRIYNITSGNVVVERESKADCLVDVGNGQLALVDAGESIVIIDSSNGKEIRTINSTGVKGASLRGISVFVADHQYLTNYGQNTSELLLWDLKTGKIARKLSLNTHIYRILPLQLRQVLLLLTEDDVHMYDFENNKISLLSDLSGYTCTPVFLDITTIAFAKLNTIIVYDVVQQEKLREMNSKNHVDEIQTLPEPHLIACLDDNATVSIWDYGAGKCVGSRIEDVEELL